MHTIVVCEIILLVGFDKFKLTEKIKIYVKLYSFIIFLVIERSMGSKYTQKQSTNPVHNKIFPFRIIKFVLHMTGILYCSWLTKLICSSGNETLYRTCDDTLNALYIHTRFTLHAIVI